MREKLQKLINDKFTKEHYILLGTLILTVLMSLWIGQKPVAQAEQETTEVSVLIPKGFLMIPLQLANGDSIASLIHRNAVIDVFKAGQKIALAQNLRVLKLPQEDGALFGALVPSDIAGTLQEIFSSPKLRGAIRTLNSGVTKFSIPKPRSSLLTEIHVDEDL
ncbi:MAG: hypothetical protein SGI74_01230 [Oligoflexia bacterium]|nr:hypothetical protein [Oligoflexia bacterium]